MEPVRVSTMPSAGLGCQAVRQVKASFLPSVLADAVETARLNKRTGRPTLYAADKCRFRAFELNKRFGLVGDRPKICACGCGAPLEQTAKKPRKFATVQCRKRAWRDVHRPNRVRRPAKSAGDVVAAPHFDIGNLAKWAKKSLVVPPGHPMAGKAYGAPSLRSLVFA